MATAMKQEKATDQRTRSLELAEARGETACSWRAHMLGCTLDEPSGALVSLALAIHSAHDTNTVYAVGYDARQDDATCDCPAARYGGRHGCWHRGLAIIKGRSVARLYSPAGRAAAERAHHADLAAEANAAVMASWL